MQYRMEKEKPHDINRSSMGFPPGIKAGNCAKARSETKQKACMPKHKEGPRYHRKFLGRIYFSVSLDDSQPQHKNDQCVERPNRSCCCACLLCALHCVLWSMENACHVHRIGWSDPPTIQASRTVLSCGSTRSAIIIISLA